MAQNAIGLRLRGRDSPDWCYEAIASARNVRHVTSAIMAIEQRLAKIRDVNAKVRIFHQQVRPDLVHQVSPRNGFSGPLDECNQDIERTTAKRYRLVVSVQDASGRRESKRSEGQDLLRPHSRIIRHERFTCAGRARLMTETRRGSCTRIGYVGLCHSARSGPGVLSSTQYAGAKGTQVFQGPRMVSQRPIGDIIARSELGAGCEHARHPGAVNWIMPGTADGVGTALVGAAVRASRAETA